jgi:aminoglycoside phosphotransferase family enzyme/predicted kinase
MGSDPPLKDQPPSTAPAGRLAADIEAWLRAGAGGEAPCERVIETSISWVFLFADRALKLKKPVELGFLDFSTLAKREWATRRELAFNKAAAPDIYRRVLAIHRDVDGALSFDGAGPVAEWALEMRRFDETAMLANRLPAVDGAFAEALGRRIARYHLDAAPGVAGGGSAGLRYVTTSNAQLLRGETSTLGVAETERLIALTGRALEKLAPLLDRRAGEGFVRGCHGDLHLNNILLEAGRPILFDCIEFNDRLREIDVLYDIAFLLMDLSFRGAAEAANRVMNGWLDEAARGFGAELWAGLAALPLFQAVRATVRAHVNALEGGTEESRRYLAAAQRYLQPQTPVLAAVGGLSGSGKSTLARALAPPLGPPPGAVVLRSDEIRKRLWGREPADRLPPAAYAPEASAAVYDELYKTAAACLQAGRAVVADAVFLRPEERSRIEAVAREAGAPFHGVWLEASADLLRQRIAARRNDASDADIEVLEGQLARDPGPIAWLRDTGALGDDLQRRLGLPEPHGWS